MQPTEVGVLTADDYGPALCLYVVTGTTELISVRVACRDDAPLEDPVVENLLRLFLTQRPDCSPGVPQVELLAVGLDVEVEDILVLWR